MAKETCSSSFSSIQTWCYDVFVSFCGKDIRYGFTDHLFAALDQNKIRAFRDDKKLERGKDIWTELEKAIETSRIAVIVFSRNYVNSGWCLDELVKIMECKHSLQQIVLPVFNVHPSKVPTQKENLTQVSDSDDVEDFGEEKLQRWRAALTEAANLAGWDLQNKAHCFESKCIEDIIEDILIKLNLAYFSVTPYPVGIESRVREINKHLDTNSGDVHMIGLWGWGGVGKTTIAQAIYNLRKSEFEGSCFLGNVRERAHQSNGLIDSQEQILCVVQAHATKKVGHVDEGTRTIKDMIQGKRILLVFDDVDSMDQFDKLAIRRDYFQPGSIIIITSRDQYLLHAAMVHFIYEVPLLDYDESLQLFSWHAFGKDHPNENYEEYTKKVICYTKGLPLLLKVLGSGPFGKSTYEWNSAFKQLEDSRQNIFGILMVCFDLLSDKEKKLFLNIALFFAGMEKNYTLKTLQDSDLSLESELRVLVRRGLVTIDCLNRLTMHDVIKEMGREIVRRQSLEEPREYRKLWSHEDVLGVHKYHKGLAFEGNVRYDWSSFHEYQQKTMFFEDQGPIGKNLYLSGIPEMTSMIHTECVRHLASKRRMWKAENRLLRHKLENQQRALQDTREDAAMASWQLKVENVALKSEITHLHMALAHARQFIPQLYVDLPSPPFVPKNPSSLSSNTIASSSTTSIQSTISTIVDVASARLDTLSLNFDAFLDAFLANEDLSIIHLREALTAFQQ